MQMVILAGGLATRLGKLAADTPKSMILINGKPFLEYQINLLKKHGIRDLVLCIGHLGEKIESYFGNGNNFDMEIRYSWEQRPLGTGGALKNAEALLKEDFLLLYGDSYLPIEYPRAMRAFQESDALGTMVVYKNYDLYDKSNVVLNSNRILIYDKNVEHQNMHYIDAGLSIYKKKVLEMLAPGQIIDLSIMVKELVNSGLLCAWETDQRFYEIGSLQGLRDFHKYLQTRKYG